jgi:hypothetical protein
MISRRGFLKGIAQAAAVVAAAKVGLGNITAESVHHSVAVPTITETRPTFYGMKFIVDPNCPPDAIYFIDRSQCMDPSKTAIERSKYAASIKNLQFDV